MRSELEGREIAPLMYWREMPCLVTWFTLLFPFAWWNLCMCIWQMFDCFVQMQMWYFNVHLHPPPPSVNNTYYYYCFVCFILHISWWNSSIIIQISMNLRNHEFLLMEVVGMQRFQYNNVLSMWYLLLACKGRN